MITKNKLFKILLWSQLYRSISDLCLFSMNFVRRTFHLKAFTDGVFCRTISSAEARARRHSTAQVHHQYALAQPFPLFSFSRMNLLFLAAGTLTVGGCILFCQLLAF